jgi:copper(I)-binding protein
VSRARQTRIGTLRILPAALGLGLAAALGMAGCGVGQVTQTDSMLPAVNGTLGQVGQIAIRNAMLAYPHEGNYAQGGDAPLVLTIVNRGGTDDQLVDVSSPLATEVEVQGDRNLPAGTALAVGTPDEEADGAAPSSAATTVTPTSPTSPTESSVSPTESQSPSAPGSSPSEPASGSSSVAPTTSESVPVEIGKVTLVLKGLTADIASGRTIPVTFVFANAGAITLELPIATPNTARPAPSEGESHG